MSKQKRFLIITLAIIFTLIIGIYLIYSSVEYSMYKVLDGIMSYNYEPANISTKCMANTDFVNDLDSTDKAMFMALFNIKEIKDKQSCSEYLNSEYSLTNSILTGIQANDNVFKQRIALLNFIIKKETIYGGSTYGCSYKCKDNDIAEKVCSIFNNDDSYDDFYFKKVNSQWILFKIEPRSL